MMLHLWGKKVKKDERLDSGYLKGHLEEAGFVKLRKDDETVCAEVQSGGACSSLRSLQFFRQSDVVHFFKENVLVKHDDHLSLFRQFFGRLSALFVLRRVFQ